MAALRQIVTVPLALCSFFAVFYSIGKLMIFLSMPSKIRIEYVWIVNLLDNWSRFEKALLPVTVDTILVVLFILQHSLMRTSVVKNIWKKLGLETAERSIYNLTTAATIVFLLEKWQSTPSLILWNVNVESRPILWWTFVSIHAFAWAVIYGGSLIMDLPELVGVKQVYYDVYNLLPPLDYKSAQLTRFYGHVRHPSFIGLTVILWATNLMSLDRLLLAILWTIYMKVSWRTDDRDVAYHKEQLQRKRFELSQ